MGEDKLRPGQRGYVPSRFPGTSGDAVPEEDVEGHRRLIANVADGSGPEGARRPILATDSEEPDVEGHRMTIARASEPDELLRRPPDDLPHGEG